MSRVSVALIFCAFVGHASGLRAADAPATPANFAEKIQNLQRLPGLFDVYSDAARGRILLAVPSVSAPFLLVVSLPQGLGSNDVGLDRGQPTFHDRLVEFRRAGNKLLLVQQNTRYISNSRSSA